MTLRTRDRVLLSLALTEISLIEQALAQVASSEAQQLLVTLRAKLNVRECEESDVVEALYDGSAVLVRAISVYGDPLDMGSHQARAYAQRILAAADEADAD